AVADEAPCADAEVAGRDQAFLYLGFAQAAQVYREEVADGGRDAVERPSRRGDAEIGVDRRGIAVTVDQAELLGAANARLGSSHDAEGNRNCEEEESEDGNESHVTP